MPGPSPLILRGYLVLALACIVIHALPPFDAPPLLRPGGRPPTRAVCERPHPASTLNKPPNFFNLVNNTQELSIHPELAHDYSILSTVSRIRCQILDTMFNDLGFTVPAYLAALKGLSISGVNLFPKPLDIMIRLYRYLIRPPPPSATVIKLLDPVRAIGADNLPPPTAAHIWRKGTVLVDRPARRDSGLWLRDDVLKYIAESRAGHCAATTWEHLAAISGAAWSLIISFVSLWVESLRVYWGSTIASFSSLKLAQLVSATWKSTQPWISSRVVRSDYGVVESHARRLISAISEYPELLFSLARSWVASRVFDFDCNALQPSFDSLVIYSQFLVSWLSSLDPLIWDLAMLNLVVLGSAIIVARATESADLDSSSSFDLTNTSASRSNYRSFTPPRAWLMIEWYPNHYLRIPKVELRLPLSCAFVTIPTDLYESLIFYKLCPTLRFNPSRPQLLLEWYPAAVPPASSPTRDRSLRAVRPGYAVYQPRVVQAALTESHRFERAQAQQRVCERVEQEVQGVEIVGAEETIKPKKRRTRRGKRGGRNRRSRRAQPTEEEFSDWEETSQVGEDEQCELGVLA